MHKETREDKEIHGNQQYNAKNKQLTEMSDEEFAAEFDRLTDDDAKKAIEKMQQNAKNGES